MKLLSDSEECRVGLAGGQFADFSMDLDTKHTEQFFSAPCDKSTIEVSLENGFADQKETSKLENGVENDIVIKTTAECNGSAEESSKTPTQNGESVAPSENSLRGSPAPSTISEAETELKLVYSSENEDDAKNSSSSLVNGEVESKSQNNKDEEAVEAMQVEEKVPPSEETTQEVEPLERLDKDATPEAENVTSPEDLEPKILEACTDATADFSEEPESDVKPEGDIAKTPDEEVKISEPETKPEETDAVDTELAQVERSEEDVETKIAEASTEAPPDLIKEGSDDKIEDGEENNPFFEESVDISDNSETENDSVANIIKNLEMDEDGHESDSSLEREIANEDISNIDNDDTDQLLDVASASELQAKEKSEDEEKGGDKEKVDSKEEEKEEPKSPKIADDSGDKTDVEEEKVKSVEDSKPESMEVEESESEDTKSLQDKMEEIHDKNQEDRRSSVKRSLDPEEVVSNDAKKMRLEDKEDDEKGEEKSEPEPRSSPRLKVKKDIELAEKPVVKSKTVAKNFFNLDLTEEELRSMGSVTRMSKKDLEKLVVSKTLETVALRSKLSAKHQEVLTLQERVSEYKKKIPPLNKQVHDLNNVVLRLEQSMKKNPKPARPLKVTRSVGLQVSFNGPMPPKMGANAPTVRQGVKTLRPVTRPGGSTPLQPAKQASPSPAAKPVRAPAGSPNVRQSTSTTPAKSLPPPVSPRALASQSQAPVARVAGVPSIATVPMSALQSPQQSGNTALVLPRQSTRPNEMPEVDDRSAQVRAGQMIAGQQFVMQNGKRFILPPQVSEVMAKQGSNSPVAYIVQSPQSQPMLITPSGQPTGQSLSSLNLQWVKNMQTRGVQQTVGQRPLNAAASIQRPNQMGIRPNAQGVPLQRGPLYTVGPPVASISRNQTFMQNRIQHPAPLPSVPQHPPSRVGWKLAPPKPILKISKVQNGIVLSWNMSMTNDHEDMKSYQIYAYQETKDPPSSSLWKTVGDVKALALPMACTLTQFKEGHKYHFSVRAVDVHSRMGPHSDPTSIVLK